ncbi:MAG: hypothetical protein QNM02_07840 [Acidimicrobiia bacterium]|nr:hypothetical protein [Acidimicrobiia bacterium]
MSDRRRGEPTAVAPVAIVELRPVGSNADDNRSGWAPVDPNCSHDSATPDAPLDADGHARSLTEFVDPQLVDAIADWHRQYVTSAPPSRAVGFERRSRSGHAEEIQLTLRSRPALAQPTACEMRDLDSTARRLRVDASTLRHNKRELTWDAVLLAPIWRRRRATLKLFASPSSNVSVLTLVPTKPHRVARKHFLRAGIRALEDVCRRIDAEVDAQLVAD